MQKLLINNTENPDPALLNGKNKSLVSILKAGVGTGLLVTPFVFKTCGIILAPIVLIGCAYICYRAYCMTLDVLDNVDPNNKRVKLFEVTKQLLGDRNGHILRFINILYNFGTCTGYVLLILKNLMITLNLNENILYKIVLSLVLGVVFVPISLKRNLAYITKYSYLAIFTQIGIFTIISLNSISVLFMGRNNEEEGQHHENQDEETMGLNKMDFTAVPFTFGLVFFMFDMSNVYSDLRNSMRNLDETRPVLQQYFAIVVSIAIIMGGSTYLAFGNETEELVFQNLKDSGLFSSLQIFISGLYVICLIVSLTIYNYTIFMLLEKYLGIQEHDGMKQKQLRISMYVAQAFIAIFVPSLTSLMSFQGAFCSVAILFVFPYYCIKSLYQEHPNLEKNSQIYFILVIFGICAGASSLISEIL